MLRVYSQWIDAWENQLANRDTNRVVRPFEWGLDWLEGAARNGNPGRDLADWVQRAVADSDGFFAYQTPDSYRLQGSTLTFRSPVESPYEVNNTVYAEYYPAPNHNGRAALVLPQWNSDPASHLGLCRLLNRFGISALRMSLAYHHHRMPSELQRADYHVSANLGRTIHATRQSVVDARACLDWLQRQGYARLATVGTSLGSCIALLTAAHERRLRAAVFNHISMYFSDVVWTGISCRHIQQTLHSVITQEDLRRYWAIISPATFLERLKTKRMHSLLIWAAFDTTFLPEFSRQVLQTFRALHLPHQAVCLPCGHYTSGRFPFNLWDGLLICRYLHRRL
jgi:hypothetical protein